MTFCMVTTFYPPYHFGGDGTYVDRLARALVARGHRVDVIHDRDAFYLAHPAEPSPVASPPPGVRVFPLKSPWGALSPLVTHQTSRPWLKPALRRRLESEAYDVIHFHNASLIGAGAFRFGRAVKLYTTHEYWLLCPLSLLWKKERERCRSRECVSCTVHAGRPPQWWRYTGYLQRQLRHIDCVIAPSRFARDLHREWGMALPFEVLPSFVPHVDAERDAIAETRPPHPRPYFLFVGRLVSIKGLHTILDTFRHYRDADLLVAGTGDQETALRQQAASAPSIHFLGQQSAKALDTLYRHAIGLVMPSICDEVFGLVLIEALAHGTPVIARRLAGMAEVVHDSEGGLLFDDEAGLVEALRRVQHEPKLRDRLSASGRDAVTRIYSEDAHLASYLALVERLQRQRGSAS